MNIIHRNPYRILGLLGNSSEREIQKQIGIIKRYSEIGKHKAFDFDFEFIGDLSRNRDDVNQAASQIERDENKLHYSLFWFVSGNQFDEIALNNLKEKNLEKAIEIWSKTLKEEVTSKNYSSYQNLSTLYISLAVNRQRLDLVGLLKGIVMKGGLINSEYLGTYSELVSSGGSSIGPERVSRNFVDEIIELLTPKTSNGNAVSPNILINLFNTYPEPARKYISGIFTEGPIANIESSIDKTAVKLKDNPHNGDKYGEELYLASKDEISKLKSIFDENDIQLQVTINKLAEEILQCSIGFFNELRDSSELDPGESALKVAQYARALGASGQTKSRLDENTRIIQEWVDSKDERQNIAAVNSDLALIKISLTAFGSSSSSVKGIEDVVKGSKPVLLRLRYVLGKEDDFYLQISDAVVNNASDRLVALVNQSQKMATADRNSFDILRSVVAKAVTATNTIGELDMSLATRARFDQNRAAINDMNSKFQSAIKKAAIKAAGPCYVATMAYGHFSHPQVIELRKFRDNTLSTTAFGRGFIKSYYIISPPLVKLLRNQEQINRVIRFILDRFIGWIKK